MKIVRRIFWITVLVMLVAVGIGTLVSSIAEQSYALGMQELDVKNAKGTLIAGYDVKEETYTRSYIPKELLAKKPEQVGYLLNLTYGRTGAAYSGGHYVTGKTITAQLVDCDTGKVIAENTFEPYFPMTVSSKTKTVSVDSSVVTNWISKVYPGNAAGQNTAGKDADHVWADATCTAPKTCTDCGATEGKPLGHNFMPTVCTRCGMEAGGQKQEAPAQTKPVEEAPEDTLKSLIAGKWKLDMLLDANTFEYISYDGELTLQINKDFSAFFSTPEGKYNYDWVFNYIDYEDNNPNKCIYYFLLIDEDGNEIFCNYYYDDSVAVFTEDYSVFFVR